MDQNFYYILSLAHQMYLPTEVIFELADRSYPPESFFTFTLGEWTSILSARGINAEDVYNRISAWKTRMKLVEGESVHIPALEPSFYIVQSGVQQKDEPHHQDVIEDQEIPSKSQRSEPNEEKPNERLAEKTDGINLPLEMEEDSEDDQYRSIIREIFSNTDLEQSQNEANCQIPQIDVESIGQPNTATDMSAVGILKSSNIMSDNRDHVPCMHGSDKTFFTPNDLQELLQRSDTGKDVMANAALGTLSIDSLRELSGIIARDHLKRNGDQTRLSKDILKNYSKCIELLFPNEKQNMNKYYIPAAPPERPNLGGSIHQAFKRLKRSLSRRQKREIAHQRKLSGKENASTSGGTEDNSNIEHATRWLQLNVHPWDIVLKMWKETIQPRVASIRSMNFADILKKYPHYKEELGYHLVSNIT